MGEFRSRLRSLLADKTGVTGLEFAFIASLISVAIIAAVTALGASTADMWADISNST